jgi:acyl-[acyl carrier protein]--UDP-N-acetylglucosamine O-acyltransferase
MPEVTLNLRPAAGILWLDPTHGVSIMRSTWLAIALTFPVLATAQDVSKVNGSVSIDAGQHAGNASSVNGSVNIGDNAVVQEASTVNGSVHLGAKAQAGSLHTVNGAETLAQAAQVRGDASSTNGSISLAEGADVSGNVSNVNGAIRLDRAHVGGNIETTSGDILIGEGSRVDGGIVVNEQHGWSFGNRPPHVVIGPHAIVRGTLEFHREVVLQVSDSAQIGPVKGATAMRFSGAQPLN